MININTYTGEEAFERGVNAKLLAEHGRTIIKILKEDGKELENYVANFTDNTLITLLGINDKRDYYFLLDESDGTVAASMCVDREDSDYVIIDRLYVDESRRREGVLKAFIDLTEKISMPAANTFRLKIDMNPGKSIEKFCNKRQNAEDILKQRALNELIAKKLGLNICGDIAEKEIEIEA